MPDRVSQRIYYSGRVQGVGFRYSVKQIAAGYEVVGSVRNLEDGRVQMEAVGEREEIDSFLAAIRKSHLATYIRHVEQVEMELSANCPKSFEITH